MKIGSEGIVFNWSYLCLLDYDGRQCFLVSLETAFYSLNQTLQVVRSEKRCQEKKPKRFGLFGKLFSVKFACK